MAREKYISVGRNVSGFSFANLGLFTGFASGIVNAVYSLVLLSIFKMFFNEETASAAVGAYAAVYALFAVFVGFFQTKGVFSSAMVFSPFSTDFDKKKTTGGGSGGFMFC